MIGNVRIRSVHKKRLLTQTSKYFDKKKKKKKRILVDAELKDLTYLDRLRILKLPSLEDRCRRCDMVEAFQYMREIYRLVFRPVRNADQNRQGNNFTRASMGKALSCNQFRLGVFSRQCGNSEECFNACKSSQDFF